MDLEQQLRAALVPSEPGPEPMASVMARLSRRRGAKVTFVVGSLLVIAAAAAVLTAQRTDAPEALLEAGLALPDMETVEPVATEQSPLMALQPAFPPAAASFEVIPEARPFTVSVQLQNQAAGEAAPAVEWFYTALLDNLRAVPGLSLVESRAGSAATRADYQLVVLGQGPMADSKFAITVMEGQMELPGVGTVSRTTFGSSGAIVDPLALMASIMESIRSKVLPEDPDYKQRLQARLGDSALDSRSRLKALTDLRSMGRRASGSGGPALDAEGLRGAVDLAARTSDTALRAQIWRVLRGVGSAELVPALVGALRDERDVEVRLEVIATMGADFRDNAEVRQVLERAAREEQQPLLRALAQRPLAGDGEWKQYIVSSLRDSSRPVAERIEAFSYQMYGGIPGSSSTFKAGDRSFLDEEVIRALAQVLPQATNLPATGLFTVSTATHLLSLDNPAGISLVLEMLSECNEPDNRSNLVSLIVRYSKEAPGRKALEKIGTDHPDLELRQIATDLLESTPSGRD